MIGVEIASTRTRLREVIYAIPKNPTPNSQRIPAAPHIGSWEWGPGSRALSRLQPLYGINGTAVDADFKVQRGRPRGRHADPADFCSAIHSCALGRRDRAQVAVQGIGVGAMVDDNEVSKAGERIGVGDGARMEGAHGRAF